MKDAPGWAAQGSIAACWILVLRSRVLLPLLALLAAACAPAASPTPTVQVTWTASPPSPEAGWIDVVLEDQMVYLRQGDELLAAIPISSGVGNSPSTATYPGEYIVETMYPGPEETVPGVFVRDIVIFDWEHGNGFHSMPSDADGNILDATMGRPASAGCIRVRDSSGLYAFAKLGMRVVIR